MSWSLLGALIMIALLWWAITITTYSMKYTRVVDRAKRDSDRRLRLLYGGYRR